MIYELYIIDIETSLIQKSDIKIEKCAEFRITLNAHLVCRMSPKYGGSKINSYVQN